MRETVRESMEGDVLVTQTVSQGSKIPTMEDRKLFLGGLPQESSLDSLRTYFSQFGEVQEVEIMKDPVTKRSRGFGFVTFKDAQSVTGVGRSHMIDKKMVEVKPAYQKGEEALVQNMIHSRKIFIGGLTKEMTKEKIKEYFENYQKLGKVVSVDLKKDKNTEALRGFGFVDFSTKDAVDHILKTQFHHLCGKKIEVKSADPRGRTRPVEKAQLNMYGYGRVDAGLGAGMEGGGNYYQPYGGHFSTFGSNSYGGGAGVYGGTPAYSGPGGYGSTAPTGYGAPPPGPPPPGQYGFPQPSQGRGSSGYAQQQVGSYGPQNGTGYIPGRPGGYTPAHQPGAEVGYPPNIGYNNYADQSAGYHQQQYYDPQQGPNHAGGYGRGSQITQRGGYYGGQ